MATLVKSQLNPLADAFIPTNRLNVYKNKRISELIVAESEFEPKKNRQRNGKQDSNETAAKLESYKELLLKDTIYYERITSISTGFKSSSIIDQKPCMLGSWHLPKSSLLEQPNLDKLYGLQNSHLPMVERSNDCDQELVQKSVDEKSCMFGSWDLPMSPLLQKPNVDQKSCVLENLHLPMVESFNDSDQVLVKEFKTAITLTPEIDVINEIPNEEENECICPPMFGWVVPPDFIGNPFNFKYECSKKYPHSPDFIGNPFKYECSEKSHSPNSDADINEWTLDECYSAMKDIVTDVIDTVSVDSGIVIDCEDEKKIIKDDPEVPATDISETESNEMKEDKTESSCLENTFKAPKAELTDDGLHPLLTLAPAIEEDEKDLVKKVEKILERSLSPLPESLIVKPEDEDPCSHLPCSQWCDWCPSDARETYNRFIQRFGNAKDCNEVYPLSSMRRPFFKRSFSAGDAPMYGRLGETSAVESRDMLLLRRQDPLNYFQMRSNSLLNGRKYVSCDLTDQKLYANSNAKSSMWGKFDGADSLWQPLPECTPLNSINQKPNIYKKGRDTRRQRTS